MSSDVKALLHQSQGGDRAARATLARWCLPRVRRTVAVTCGGGPEGDDVVQNVMATVLTKLHTYRGDADFFVWVDRITVNEIRGMWRRQGLIKRKLRLYAADPTLGQRGPATAPDDDLLQQRLLQATAEHIRRLKEGHRVPVVLNLLHGYTTPEIAALLGLSLEAAKKRLQRGKKELEARLRRDPACRGYFEGGLS